LAAGEWRDLHAWSSVPAHSMRGHLPQGGGSRAPMEVFTAARGLIGRQFADLTQL